MVDVTASLDAATQQILGLMAQLKLGNIRALQAQDTGAADAYVVAPVPAVASIGPDLLLLIDIANPNATTNPKLTIQGLPQVAIVAADGSPPAIGSVAGKRLIGFASLAGGGYVARLIGLAPADITSIMRGLYGVKLLTGSGTYVPTVGAKNILSLTAGGGGSGGSGNNGNTANGGGGGSGQVAVAMTALSAWPNGVPYTHGAGGAQQGGNGLAGNAGGASTFGPSNAPIAQALGGVGGTGVNSATGLGQGGGYNGGGIGTMLLTGNPGTVNTGGNQAGNGGAAPIFGGGGLSGVGTNISTPGSNGGGGGGGNIPNLGPIAGAAGGNGCTLVLEFA